MNCENCKNKWSIFGNLCLGYLTGECPLETNKED